MVAYLLNKYPEGLKEVSKRGRTPFLRAVTVGNLKIVQYLIDYIGKVEGAEGIIYLLTHRSPYYEDNSISEAAYLGHTDIIEHLLVMAQKVMAKGSKTAVKLFIL